jgi:predicted ATPase
LTSASRGTPRLHIVTGAHGTGKTAIIQRLGPAIHRMPEPARAVIADYRLIEGPDAGQPPVEVFVT